MQKTKNIIIHRVGAGTVIKTTVAAAMTLAFMKVFSAAVTPYMEMAITSIEDVTAKMKQDRHDRYAQEPQE